MEKIVNKKSTDLSAVPVAKFSSGVVDTGGAP
jgi:hypothetical protein